MYSCPLYEGMGNLPVRSAAVHSDLCKVETVVSGEDGVEARRTDRRRETGNAPDTGKASDLSLSRSSQSFKKAKRRRD